MGLCFCQNPFPLMAVTATPPLLPSFETMVTQTLPGTQNKRISAPALLPPYCPSLATDLLAEYKYDVDRSIQLDCCIHTRVLHNKYVGLVYIETAGDSQQHRSLSIADRNHRALRQFVSHFNEACEACREQKEGNTYLCRWCYEVTTRHSRSPLMPILCVACRHESGAMIEPKHRPNGAPVPPLQCTCPSCGKRVRRLNRDRTDRRFMCNRCLLQQAHGDA